jgi:type II secretory ATPase GspE/PulE/Tfp pilus assembly ATPase PilB-like protein
MQELLMTTVEYGGYVSEVKLILFLIPFFLWLRLVAWVFEDAGAVGAEEALWTAVVFGTGAIAAIVFMLVPVFVIGILLYVIAVFAPVFAYARHRDSKVMEYDRILTVDCIKNLLAGKSKERATSQGLLFVTANGNEVPVPEAKTPDFFGYQTAQRILKDAHWRRASDVTFAPMPQEYRVIYQVDGAALKQPSLARNHMEYLIRFLKNLAALDLNEKRKPQKGQFRIIEGKERTDWEVATAGSTAGEQVTLTHITRQESLRLPDIGLTPGQYEQFKKISRAKQGLVLISGPRKSGTTTTVYALLRNHDAFLNSINTLERQIGGTLPNITQDAFALSDTGTTTFAKKLLSIVRMGPDIVGVDDCQDAETAKVIAKAATDGKLIYLVLEADSAIKALVQWLKLVRDKAAAIEPLLVISNQRLFRILCDECKQGYAPNKELLRKFNIPAEKAKVLYRAGKVKYGKRGKETVCDKCQGTGFVGRTAIFETMIMGNQLRKAVRQAKSLSDIDSHLRSVKMAFLQERTLKLVIDGVTSINEMVRVLAKSGNRNTGKSG